MVFSQFVYKMYNFSLTKKKTKTKKYCMHCILNVHISIQKHTKKKYKKLQMNSCLNGESSEKSVARSLAHLSRSLSCGFISRAAAAATGVSRAVKWFPAYGHSQSRPWSAETHTDKTKRY